MATHTAPTQNLNTRQKISIHVAAFQPDGETPDTSATLTTSNSSPATCSVAVDPADNRIITITANGAGNSSVVVGFTGCNDTLTIPVSVVLAPNLSRVDFLSADPPVNK